MADQEPQVRAAFERTLSLGSSHDDSSPRGSGGGALHGASDGGNAGAVAAAAAAEGPVAAVPEVSLAADLEALASRSGLESSHRTSYSQLKASIAASAAAAAAAADAPADSGGAAVLHLHGRCSSASPTKRRISDRSGSEATSQVRDDSSKSSGPLPRLLSSRSQQQQSTAGHARAQTATQSGQRLQPTRHAPLPRSGAAADGLAAASIARATRLLSGRPTSESRRLSAEPPDSSRQLPSLAAVSARPGTSSGLAAGRPALALSRAAQPPPQRSRAQQT